MKIGVVGCGAVGSFYGLMLKQAGEDVHFHLRGNYEDVKKHGFSLIQQSIGWRDK
jgi:2-dehydropantoate 2-reductase